MENQKDLGRRAAEATVKFVVVLAVMIFVAAGSLSYWQGWLFLVHFCGWIVATTAYFFQYDRALLEQRLHVGPGAERQPAQKRIQLFNGVVLIGLFLGSALDHRFGWSAVPPLIVMFGNVLVAAGFYGCFLVLRQNRFASATVEIRADQRVVSSGLYGIVRHPMYAAALVLFVGMPLSLGSYWGLLAIPPAFGGLVARLLDEEKHLTRDLPGYAEYRRKVRSRLLPGLW
ncbi:isoprenylcysteine carboxylmethyltransferase family protein [Rhizobium sp. NZLR3b]|uniref:methyltransferase family protein n=1 Tax=Rhizobium sp. NZLR3b TaxID=2731101 RepID=UPI001C838072|nr:isoprenylcysteine carboxylmethyltransferase family protein [Rhizobium sp. NZLR3b]MBX5192734.1 isoprenylcysteine carboxylmethyltransferase family protein [Rhizobium sp. NZLR3b]